MSYLNNVLKRRDFIRTGVLTGFYLLGSGFISGKEIKIALIGDTVRKGYQDKVSAAMKDNTTIWSPKYEDLNTINILQDLKNWITYDQYDIIHINSGFNDLRTIDYYTADPVIPLSLYSRNIESIIKMINRYSPGTLIVWATTTPVVDEWFETYQAQFHDYNMTNEDVVRYNDAARDTATRLGAAVNDLYEFIMEGDPKLLMRDDGFRYTDFGYQVLGERVTMAINKILNNM